ncbi:Methylosome subunit pICln [Frankliniella fusca]|uniref:Methylosome subunit pICln n=1 Tax=Frankliniella fusca TaxID=407009 RepID=A0AAE1L931_9NEOP|nr:Methylosome subunit pICln [Frankliniella fusca]
MVIITNYVPNAEEVIRHQQDNTAVLMNDRNVGKGTLYISESRVSWVNASTREGFTLEYPNITLHAISRTPEECLYMMLDTNHLPIEDCTKATLSFYVTIVPGYNNDKESGDEDDSDEDPEDGQNTILKFLPDDSAAIEAMYQAMSQCQALHPDPEQQSDSDPENIFVDADGEEEVEGEDDGQDDAEYDGKLLTSYLKAQDFEPGTNGNGQATDEAMEVDSAQFEDADSDIDN